MDWRRVCVLSQTRRGRSLTSERARAHKNLKKKTPKHLNTKPQKEQRHIYSLLAVNDPQTECSCSRTSHLLNCSAHLKSTADVKPDAWEWMPVTWRLTLISNACEKPGLQLRLASLIPAELVAMAGVCLCPCWDRRLWGSFYSSVAVSSARFRTSLTEGASPLLRLPSANQLYRLQTSSSLIPI